MVETQRKDWGVPERRRERSRPRTAVVTLAMLVPGLLFGLAPPAGASHYELTWTSPDPGETTPVLQGTREVDLRLWSSSEDLLGKVERWTFEVLDADGNTTGVLCSEDYTGAPVGEPSVKFDWDTRFYAAGEPSSGCDADPKPTVPATLENRSRNGSHTFKVWTETVLRAPLFGTPLATEHETFTRQVMLDNPPLAPTGVGAVYNAATQLVTVSWNAALEPDGKGYAVDACVKTSAQEACSSGDWSRVASPDGRATTSVSLGVSKLGVYRYRVAAVRPHADGSDFFSSATVTQTLSVGAVSGHETTSAPGGVSGGSESPGGEQSSTTGAGTGGKDGTTGGGSGVTGDERNRGGAPSRLVERTEVDAGYEEALPYGTKPLERARGGAFERATRGVGPALVPIAGGLALLVFAMQMRYLSRKAEALAIAAEGPSVAVADDVPPPVPLFRLGAGGSFISNWKRLLED